jgi:hemoglobin
MNATPTLYAWAGGDAAIRRLMEAFYDRVERDELLSPYFPGGVSEQHRAHVATWWSEVLGGPARYTQDLGGYEKMLAHHRGLAISAQERHRFVSLLSLAADDAALPDDPEFRSALVAYAEWGSRLAMHNPQPDAQVFEHAPVPRWGWGEAPPFQR